VLAAFAGVILTQAAIDRDAMIHIHGTASQSAFDVRTDLSRSSQKRPAIPTEKIKSAKDWLIVWVRSSDRLLVESAPLISVVRPFQPDAL
jgi:hypothetical protein